MSINFSNFGIMDQSFSVFGFVNKNKFIKKRSDKLGIILCIICFFPLVLNGIVFNILNPSLVMASLLFTRFKTMYTYSR